MSVPGTASNPLYTEHNTIGTATTGAGSNAPTGTSAQVVAANTSRRGLSIVNTGTVDVSLGLGATAVAGSGILLAANGGAWDGLISGVLWTGAVNAITTTGTGALGVVEV